MASKVTGRGAGRAAPLEIAPGVYYVAVGKGFMRANVYLVRSGPAWTLIDAGSPGCAEAILAAAQSIFGEGSPASAILLTHHHPDHTGAARELALRWRCPVWAHPDEVALLGGDLAMFHEYAHPLDRWVILPGLRLMGAKRAGAIMERSSLRDVAQAFDPGIAPPGLPEWEAVPSPGHSPGHVAFFRRTDRVLISGDALLTVDVSSPAGFLLSRQQLSGPPWYVTWDRQAARQAAISLAELGPLVLGAGHGNPMTGPETVAKTRAFAAELRHLQQLPVE